MAVLGKLFDERFYLKQNPDVAEAVARGDITADSHFALYGLKEGRNPGPWFNALQYLQSNPDVKDAVSSGDTTALQHFVDVGVSEGRSPLHYFNPQFYLQQNSDVAGVVEDALTTASQHFVLYGLAESRIISPAVNLGAYLSANPDVELAVEDGAFTAINHLLWHGLFEGRDLGNGVSLAFFAADAIFQNALTANDVIAALERLDAVAPFLPSFVSPPGWAPAADMIIPVDFIPPPGIKLVIPDGVVVPPGLVLPDTFKNEGLPPPDTSEPDDHSVPDSGPTFSVEIDCLTGTVRFGGTAAGDISLTWTGAVGASVARFTRDGKKASADFAGAASDIELGAIDILAAMHADILGVPVTGPGTVRLMDVELSASEILTTHSAISACLDATAVTTITGVPSEIQAFDADSDTHFIKPTGWTARLTRPVSVVEANSIDALAGPRIVQAEIVESDTTTLKKLTGIDNSYFLSVARGSSLGAASAADLNQLNTLTTAPLDVTRITSVSGGLAELLQFKSAIAAGQVEIFKDWSAALLSGYSDVHEAAFTAEGPADVMFISGQVGAMVDLTNMQGFETINLNFSKLPRDPMETSEVIIADGAGTGVIAVQNPVTVYLGELGQQFSDFSSSAHGHTVYGGSGSDAISGGRGHDIISGGAGADVLTGDGPMRVVDPAPPVGNDIFVFAEGDSNITDTIDEITDFLTGNDTIKTGVAGTSANYAEVAGADGGATRTVLTLNDIVETANARFADLNAGGTQYAVVSNANTNAQGAAATFSYLLIDWDGNNTADHAIKLTGLTDLSRVGPHHIVE